MVGARWSAVKICTGIALQSALSRPELVSTGATACARLLGSRGSTRHFGLPSFQPALIALATCGSESVERTPSTFAMCQAKRSISSITAWSTQPSGTVSTITWRTSTPIAKCAAM